VPCVVSDFPDLAWPRVQVDMGDRAEKLLQLEMQFVAGVQAKLAQAQGHELAGDVFRLAHHDQTDQVKALMAARGMYDRRMLGRLPRNRRVVLHAYKRRWWWLGRKRLSVTVASVLSPAEQLIDQPEQAQEPATLSQLIEHVRSVVTDDRTPHLVAICSTTGFTDEARRARTVMPNVELVLVEPTDAGTWRLIDPTGQVGEGLCCLFDPENPNQKFQRVRREIESRSVDLLSGGLSADSVAARVELPRETVVLAFERAVREDRHLRVTNRDGQCILFRGPDVRQEATPMSMIERIRQLFARQGDEAKKIEVLTERRAGLAQRRDRIYTEIEQLERQEGRLKQEGAANTSQVVRRRLAAQLAQLRREITRQNTSANMLSQQINIINTHIHNLALIQQGQAAELPTAEEITEDAVRAEEMLEQVRADSDLVSSLETGTAAAVMSDEEKQILAEFDQAAKQQAEAGPQPEAAEPAAPAEPDKQKQPPEAEA
jgi:hypothetical protein